MRSLITLAVRRRVTVLMTAIALAAFGIVGYQRLSLDLLPDISYPSLTVQTEFPDTAPAEVENLVTRPVEEAVGVLRGLRMIHSVSRPGISEVTLEFAWASDMDLLLLDVREKLDRLILPQEANDPIVLRYDPSLDPIMRLALISEDLTRGRRLADLKLKPAFETIPGVASARIQGGLEEEIQIDVNQERLAALGIPLSRIEDLVGVSNINLPGGLLRGADTQYLIRTVNEYRHLEEIGNLLITSRSGDGIRLKDLARIQWGARDREEITRINGKESIEIDVFKEGDANIVASARLIRDSLDTIQDLLPEGYKLKILFDQSRFIENAIREVRSAALIGGFLAILILFLFLRSWRATLIIATSIPLSVLFTFVAMYRMDISLNIMSLGGLTLGIGMLVDNAIVVLEAIHRKKDEGLSLVRAAIDGASEVGAAVFASTLTTVAVFLPIIFVEGIAGQLFKDMALTVSLSLTASLIVAITLIPMLSAIGRKNDSASDKPEKKAAADPGSPGLVASAYEKTLVLSLRHPWLTLGLALIGLGLAIANIPGLHRELIPEIAAGEFFFEASLPEGTTVDATDRVLQKMGSVLAGDPEVSMVYTTAGRRQVSGGQSMNTRAEHFGQLNVVLTNKEASEEAVAEKLRKHFALIPDLEARFGKPSYFNMKTPVEILLFGDDLSILARYGHRLGEYLERIEGLVDLRSSLEEGNPEVQIIFDRARLVSLGLDMRSVADTLKKRVLGSVPTRFRQEDRQIDIRIRNRVEERNSLDDIRNLVVQGKGDQPLRLLSIAEVRRSRGPAEIHRISQQRAAVLSADIEGRSLGAIVRDIRELLAQVPPPKGVLVNLGGQIEEMEGSFASLGFALILAVFLVYLVMASTFESLIHPLIVIFSVPLALIGVVFGLRLTSTPVSIIVFIGIVMLIGIVVNNAIVLIDTVNQLRQSGMKKYAAVIKGAGIRLRPILMTTLTTVLGLLPMALSGGEGAELRAPLAITVSFGLSFSTLLTLLVIPVLYLLIPSGVRAVDDPENRKQEPTG